MATTANPPPGATPTHGPSDPFVGSSNQPGMRYASLDPDQFSLYSTSSPSQAKRALEAHLRDTERRIQDASRLGTTLLQQRKDLSARLQEVESVQEDNEVPTDLRKKLADLEREYNEVGKESARAFLPKSRVSSAGEATATPSALTGSGRESPTKLTAPSRRQRNQPTNRVHDIEFATEISTSLLAQVRQLQVALAEKDEELRDTTSAKAQLESDADGMMQRIKHMDDNEQRYKDENWNLETRLQDLEASHKDSGDKAARLAQTLALTQSEKSAAQRDLDDLKVNHEKLNDEHSAIKRQQETDLNGLRRDVASHETEKQKLHSKIAELTSQNTELAKAVSYRFNQPSAATDTDFVSANEEQDGSDGTPEDSAPASPVKGTPRHGMLESETLKSSLNHAHRMIQNLKNNIHREKTEKLELKRMLQDARDELETKRSDSGGVGANMGKKRRSETDAIKFKKPARPLGANRGSSTEIMEDEPDWEDHDGAHTPSKSSNIASAVGGALVGAAGATILGHAHGGDDTESTDAAFETATERGGTTDTFETGREDNDDSDELTETESNVNRSDTARKVSPLVGLGAGNRRSFQSTASTSASEDEDELKTPVQATQQQKYRLRVNRSSKRGRVDDLIADSPSQASNASPSSSMGTPQPAGQSLGDELDGLDDESVEGTPSRFGDSAAPTPETTHTRDFSAATTVPAVEKPTYADAGIMTEPWEPEHATQKSGFGSRAAEVVGGALAGFGIGRLGGRKESDAEAGAEKEERPLTAVEEQPKEVPAQQLGHSEIMSQETEPIAPTHPVAPVASVPLTHPVAKDIAEVGAVSAIPLAVAAPLVAHAVEQSKQESFAFSPVAAQEFEPVAAPLLAKRSSKRTSPVYATEEDRELSENGIPGTDGARPGAGFFGANEPKSFRGPNGKTVETRTPTGMRAPLGEIAANSVQRANVGSSSKIPMSDEGSQTLVSGDDIDSMMRDKSRAAPLPIPFVLPDSALSSARPSTAVGPDGTRRSIDGTVVGEAAPMRTPRRPASASSMRNKATGVMAPPLPDNHSQKIAAAQKTPGSSTVGTMGPPIMPASAYKQNRPRTPAEAGRSISKDGTTPRPPRAAQSSGGLSKRTSVSSFASEVDERFNGRNQLVYPDGVQPSTDPRMIQAITQTMIGEYLWKYTRKAGRSETSTTRHRRFFWIHPYTRTLYWSEKDPSTAGKDMLKAKSVAIEAVRAVTDDNTNPPGLHRKSLVVVTPGREVVFTAPTGQRHETWFNALSYLLLRTEQEKNEAEDTINQDDLDEFNPGFGSSFRRSISRIAGRSERNRSNSRASLSSYNSRTTRASSPPGVVPTLVSRDSKASAQANDPAAPPPNATGSTASRYSAVRDPNAGRLSSIASKLRPASQQRSSYGSTRGRGYSGTSGRGRPGESDIYDASVAADSAEDLRAQIEKQEQDSDRLENVRACCDGKHDVGSLSRQSRHASFGSRFVAHSHTHTHAHPRTDTISESMRGR